ncbi:MAG TPA: ATP-binding protein [Pirellulales bacterium]|nr:ATP-binding protein [Pirellulales bacterium]
MSLRLQTALLIALFLGSLSTLGFNLVKTRVAPEHERRTREQLRAASRRMAQRAETIERPERYANGDFSRLNRDLTSITAEVLADFPGVEGGFYLGDGADRFGGYAYPTHQPPRKDRRRTDPPPLESPYLRLQAKESLTIEPGEVRWYVRDVESSRVMMLTEPVGRRRPAAWSTWLMVRLIDHKQLGNQVRRYQTSTVLSIGGLGLALLLLVNLGRSLRRQRLEQARLRDELRKSEHLAALGKLLAGVAHDVRNPLAAIRSTVQLWQRLPDTARTPVSLDAVIQAVDRLNHTVTQLLHFSRADQLDRQPVQVNQLLEETLELLAAHAADQRVALERDLADKLPTLLGSANALLQVFLNLAQNALQAMPDGGMLSIQSRLDQRLGQVEVRVGDTGPGIQTADQAHLFEPFFTTRAGGTGLGLALCREIIAQHGGRIEHLPGDGPGATFRVILPTQTHASP